MFRLIRFLPLALILIVLATPVAHAEDRASFGLRPVRYDPARPATQSYFIYDAAPGQVIRDEVRVSNRGGEAGTVRLYAVDATTGRTSGAVYLEGDDAASRQQVGGWIVLEQHELMLQPGEERTVAFTVTVPPGARPGEHLGALAAEDAFVQEGAREGALQVNMHSRVVTAVQVNLPGPVVEQVTVGGITAAVEQGLQTFVLSLRNEGTHMVKPTGSLRVLDGQGEELRRMSLQLDTFLPETTIDFPLIVQGEALPDGEYSVILDLRYGQKGATGYRGSVAISREQVAQLYEAAGQQLPPLPEPATGSEQVQPQAPQSQALPTGLLLGLAVAALAAGLIGGAVIARMAGRRTRAG
jgi:hypothetical protein